MSKGNSNRSGNSSARQRRQRRQRRRGRRTGTQTQGNWERPGTSIYNEDLPF